MRDGRPDVTVEHAIDVAAGLPDVTDDGELALDEPSLEGPDPLERAASRARASSRLRSRSPAAPTPAGSSDGLSSGPMQVTASPGFSFDVGTRYMGSSYQRRQHRRDPPKIAAAYNAGSIRRSYANRWHMVSTGKHIDRFVNAYNAYRSWVLKVTKAEGTAPDVAHDVDLIFHGEHVSRPSDLPTLAVEGQVVFVGDWERRDGAFYVREGGAWRTDVE